MKAYESPEDSCDITVRARRDEWKDVLIDLGCVDEGLEAGSALLEEKLRELGIW